MFSWWQTTLGDSWWAAKSQWAVGTSSLFPQSLHSAVHWLDIHTGVWVLPEGFGVRLFSLLGELKIHLAQSNMKYPAVLEPAGLVWAAFWVVPFCPKLKSCFTSSLPVSKGWVSVAEVPATTVCATFSPSMITHLIPCETSYPRQIVGLSWSLRIALEKNSRKEEKWWSQGCWDYIYLQKYKTFLSWPCFLILGGGQSCDHTFTVHPDFVMVFIDRPSWQTQTASVSTSR